MAVKRTPLTQEQFDRLQLVGGWTIDEIPREHWDKIPGLQRLQDTFAVMSSGCVIAPGVLNGINAVAGLDVLVQEPRPMAKEPPGNAYHYVVQRTSDTRFPFIMHGPFKSETLVEHWFDAPQLDRYWSQDNGPSEPDYNMGVS
jgi:hypothetical protein